MRILSKLALTGAVFFAFSQPGVASASDSISYIPQIHGTLRPRLEVSTDDNAYRFQLRNARVSLTGMIAPQIDYFMQADFCDRGSVKFLDGWIRMKIVNGLKLQAGQFRMPFGVDAFRAPHNYIFGNRSFMGKQMFNYRAVGAKLSYTLPSRPLTIEAGAFNPKTIQDHTPWNTTVAYSAKATYRVHNVTLAAGYASISPDSVRLNALNGAITWAFGRWTAEAEYMHMHYCNRDRKGSHAYNAWIDYRMPVRAGIFNRLSFQGRFDGLTAFSNGKRTKEGLLTVNEQPRNRVTVGSTLTSQPVKNIYMDLRLDYEKYFYHSGFKPSTDNADKILLELVLRF